MSIDDVCGPDCTCGCKEGLSMPRPASVTDGDSAQLTARERHWLRAMPPWAGAEENMEWIDGAKVEAKFDALLAALEAAEARPGLSFSLAWQERALAAEARAERLRQALSAVCDELLGVPDGDYPDPVTNAYRVARAALAADRQNSDEGLTPIDTETFLSARKDSDGCRTCHRPWPECEC